MGKQIVICCDGTGNSFDKIEQESNVVKLYSCLTVNDKQITYYHPGVGTMGAPNSRGLIEKTWTKAKGLAFGSGLLPNVGDAYRFLMDTYIDGDDIFLFGFSRGAFAARVLASLVHVYGLLSAGNHELVPYILHMYAKNSKKAAHKRKTFPSDEAFKWQFSHQTPVCIKFVGIWDTVSSYGWIYDPVELPFLGSNPIIRIGRHAVSIDERRCYYQDNLWGTPNPGQDIRQVWFSGAHSDVGGSYLESESGLAKIALEWMIVEAEAQGLLVEKTKAKVILGQIPAAPPVAGLPQLFPTNANACLHPSLHGAWWLLEFLPHVDPHLKGRGWYFPLGRRRTIPPNSLIHASVFQRKRPLPPNLPSSRCVEPWVPY